MKTEYQPELFPTHPMDAHGFLVCSNQQKEKKMLLKGATCCNCGHKEGMGDECQLERTEKGNFYIHCPDCGAESSVHKTPQKAADDFYQRPRLITVNVDGSQSESHEGKDILMARELGIDDF